MFQVEISADVPATVVQNFRMVCEDASALEQFSKALSDFYADGGRIFIDEETQMD